METILKVKNEIRLNLSISIFYNPIGWHKLILNGIMPFVQKTSEVEGCFLSLSRNRGQHVKLFLTTSQLQAKQLAQKADACFNAFVLKHPIPNKKNLIPKNGFFYDFEPNTVHYGLYDDLTIASDNFILLQKEFSKLLVLIFEKYQDETILSLTEIMIEFFAIFQDALYLKNSETIDLFENLLKKEYQKYNNDSLEKALLLNEENFNENKELIIAFLKDKEYNKTMEPFQKQWRGIINNYQKWMNYEGRTNRSHLINTLCNIFDFEDRMSAYYLFLNALKLI